MEKLRGGSNEGERINGCSGRRPFVRATEGSGEGAIVITAGWARPINAAVLGSLDKLMRATSAGLPEARPTEGRDRDGIGVGAEQDS